MGKDAKIAESILKFKMAMLKREPFYGEILMRLPIREDRSIPTAATNGRWIKYNPDFMATLKEPQRNYVLLHEVLHVILRHWKRQGDRNSRLWNVACDYVVNDIIDTGIRWSMGISNIRIERPKEGLYSEESLDISAEELYQKLYEQNKDNRSLGGGGKVRVLTAGGELSDGEIPEDLIYPDETDPVYAEVTESLLKEMLKTAVEKNRGKGRCYIPDLGLELTESKRLPWKRLLCDFLEEKISDETSYFTPERKYLYMDLIIPGYGSHEDELGEIWAFIDSSGSVADDELNQFITQLYRIGKQFNCVINLAYWDMEVGKVYKHISNVSQLLKSPPNSRGGTDINCVYEYIKENKIHPGVLLILTDGYFGKCEDPDVKLKKQTIIVLSENGYDGDEVKGLGKIAAL